MFNLHFFIMIDGKIIGRKTPENFYYSQKYVFILFAWLKY